MTRAPGRGRLLVDLVSAGFPGVDAAAAVAAGDVLVDGIPCLNTRSRPRPDAHVSLRTRRELRGSAKLRAALERFGVQVAGRAAIDIGAAAGGFTAVLLEAGARRVYAVDAGHGQLVGSLRQHQRVVNLEAVNVADLNADLVPERIGVVTVDVSYLSLSAAVAQLGAVSLASDADLVGLVKPMFELRAATAPNDPRSLAEALALAVAGVSHAGWEVRGSMDSPVTGSRGAREMLLHAVRR